MTPKHGWGIYVSDSGERHVAPVDEAHMHTRPFCLCGPLADPEDERVIIHASFDGREKFETGERKPS